MSGYQGPEDVRRLPPQAVEVEQAVLGAMLISQRGVDRGVELLTAEHFYHGPHARVFDAIKALYDQSTTVDQLTLAEELKRRGQLDEVGGVVYLATLAAEVSTAANIDHHAEIVTDKAIGRHIIEVAAEMSSRAFDGQTDPKELLDWAESQICTLAERGTSREFVGMESIMEMTFEQAERVHNSTSAVTGVDTGFSELNDITSGFQPGDLIIMAARPSAGKTALALSIARNAAIDHDQPVAVFSMEMGREQIGQRLVCIETGVDLHNLRTGRLREEDFVHLTKNAGRMAEAPIFIDDTPGLTVLELRSKARQLHRREDLSLIVIDYMQLMAGTKTRGSSREQEVSEISRGLKGLARDLNVPVVGVSQLSRAVESRPDKRPQLSDLRESGTIEQDADVVTFIYRPEMYGIQAKSGGSLEGMAEVIIGKQRNGPTGSFRLVWDKKAARFQNLAPEYRTEIEDSNQYGPDRWDLGIDG